MLNFVPLRKGVVRVIDTDKSQAVDIQDTKKARTSLSKYFKKHGELTMCKCVNYVDSEYRR
jgi:hypothetical protein